MDDVLARRTLHGSDRRWPAIEAAGGLYVVPANASASELRHAVEAVGTRALEVRTGDLTVLEGLDLEYLFVAAPVADVRPLDGLPALKGLSLESWRGELDLARLPALDWFGALEVKPGQVEVLLAADHPRLTWLALGRYRNDDLTPLGRLPALATLWVGETRTLVTVDGVADLPRLRSLTLSRCAPSRRCPASSGRRRRRWWSTRAPGSRRSTRSPRRPASGWSRSRAAAAVAPAADRTSRARARAGGRGTAPRRRGRRPARQPLAAAPRHGPGDVAPRP